MVALWVFRIVVLTLVVMMFVVFSMRSPKPDLKPMCDASKRFMVWHGDHGTFMCVGSEYHPYEWKQVVTESRP